MAYLNLNTYANQTIAYQASAQVGISLFENTKYSTSLFMAFPWISFGDGVMQFQPITAIC